MKVHLSKLAAIKTKLLLEYLENEWSISSKKKFLNQFKKSLKQLSNNPYIFPESSCRKGIRRLVVTKQTSLLYQIDKDKELIYVITLFDNRQNPEKIKDEINIFFNL